MIKIGKEAEIKWFRYVYQLRIAASRISEVCTNSHFVLQNVKMTQKEFWDIVIASKKWAYVRFPSCIILTDSICNFGDMKEWNIQVIEFVYSGDKDHTNWK